MNRVLSNCIPTLEHKSKKTKNYYTFAETKGLKHLDAVIFRISFPSNIIDSCNSKTDCIEDGRVVLYFGAQEGEEPREEVDAISNPIPCFAKDIKNVKAGEMIEFNSNEYSIPGCLACAPAQLPGEGKQWFVQAMINTNVRDPDANTCSGNLYSKPHHLVIPSTNEEGVVTIDIICDQVVQYNYQQRNSDEWLQCVELKSELLSTFHKRDVRMFAAVILPKGYHERGPNDLFPVIFQIEGLTGTEFYRERADDFLDSALGSSWKKGEVPIAALRVVLGSRFTYGHTSFADSDINGPWATSLTKEFIPFLEKEFAIERTSQSRFLTGHSSGGWASLWLQIQYPEFFGGVWSSAPDPVDFRFFQLVNIYEADNMYWDSHGRPYPTSRQDGSIEATIRDENLFEHVHSRGNGGQWDAFRAVFGSADANGSPIPLYDKISGKINKTEADKWRRFDICNLLRNQWSKLKDRLQGKIHVCCGDEDNYYLDGACRSLQSIIGESSLCGNYVKMIPGDHSSIKTAEYYNTIFTEMGEKYRQKVQG